MNQVIHKQQHRRVRPPSGQQQQQQQQQLAMLSSSSSTSRNMKMSKTIIGTGGAGLIFLSSMYITYQYQRMEKQRQNDIMESNMSSSQQQQQQQHQQQQQQQQQHHDGNCNCTCTCRSQNKQYDNVASQYDTSMNYDEMIMGISFLRNMLIKHHAYGTVCEVAAGTGRNISYYNKNTNKDNNNKKNVATTTTAVLDDDNTIDAIVSSPPPQNQSFIWYLLQHYFGWQGKVNKDNNGHVSLKKTGIDRVVLIDQSEPMLNEAKNKVSSNHNDNKQQVVPSYAFVNCNIEDQQEIANILPNNHIFDTVVDTFGLCSYDNPVKALREMIRLCKKDGYILLLEHGRSNKYNSINNYYLDRYYITHYKNWGCQWNRNIINILNECSNELDIIYLYQFHFGTTYYIVCRPKQTNNIKTTKQSQAIS